MVFQKNFTKQRWDNARKLQKLHQEKTGEKLGLREYYKNDNPITNAVTVSEVTFEMDYIGESYEFFIPQESFKIYSYGEFGAEEIKENVAQGVARTFKGGASNWVYNEMMKTGNIKVRGIEKVQTKYNDVDVEQFEHNNLYADNIPNFEVGKGRTKSSANKNKYNLNIWL